MRKVFDSSAVLAFLYGEAGSETVRADLPEGVLCAVNAAEVLTVLVRDGVPLPEAGLALQKTGLIILDFSSRHAAKAAELSSPALLRRGISLGDRACMAVSLTEELPAVTADREWRALAIPGLKIELIRA